MPPVPDPALEISCRDLKQRLESGSELVLIDCREPEEHAIVHLPAAVLIPMSQWLARKDELAAFVGKELVVHCHHGMRSLQVTAWLQAHGFPQARSLAGGIDQWATEIEPTLARY